MGYIKAYITIVNHELCEGGFYTHAVSTVEAASASPSKETHIMLVGRHGRWVSVNLPVDKVNILLEHLEIEGGVLDLLEHTHPDHPKGAETPVPHRTGQGRSLTIDFNDLSEPGSMRKRPLVRPQQASPPAPSSTPPSSAPQAPKPFRPFGDLF